MGTDKVERERERRDREMGADRVEREERERDREMGERANEET